MARTRIIMNIKSAPSMQKRERRNGGERKKSSAAEEKRGTEREESGKCESENNTIEIIYEV